MQTTGCTARPSLHRVFTRFLQALSMPEAAVPAISRMQSVRIGR
jgi:hypothetical protein